MKRIVYLTCIGILALTLTSWGAQRNKGGGHGSARGEGARSAHVASPRSGGGHSVARVNRAPRSSHLSAARVRTHAAERRTVTRNRAALNRERNLTRANAQRSNRVQATQARNARVAQATRNAARRNLAVNRQRNLSLARNALHNRAGNVRVTNNWRGARFNDARYAAFRNYNRTWHDRGWWRDHHSHIVFVLGGWWYWNTGYWYPAWGYDPYGWYPYDGPIYTGYANLTPDQVVVNVQVALRDQGYYAGSVDGAMGPETRAALAAFQADNGLAVTSAVDQPTLQTLGVA